MRPPLGLPNKKDKTYKLVEELRPLKEASQRFEVGDEVCFGATLCTVVELGCFVHRLAFPSGSEEWISVDKITKQ